MSSNLELLKSVKNNAELSFGCLEWGCKGVDNLLTKKSITLEYFLVNTGQIALGSLGYLFFGNAAIDNTTRFAENLFTEIKESKKSIADANININEQMFMSVFGIPKYRIGKPLRGNLT